MKLRNCGNDILHSHKVHNSHHSNHLDQAEMFKRNSMSAQRKRKIISKLLFVLLSAIAMCVIFACILTSLA